MTPASDDADPPGDPKPPGDGPAQDAERRARGIEQRLLAEMAEEERDRTQDLAVAFLERLWRGDRISVRVATRAFDGLVVHSGQDLVTLRTTDGALVDVRIDAVLSVAVVEPGHGPRRALQHVDPQRFVARLRELADAGSGSAVFGAENGARELPGRLVRVHADHVVVEAGDGPEWLLPLTTIAYVLRPGPEA